MPREHHDGRLHGGGAWHSTHRESITLGLLGLDERAPILQESLPDLRVARDQILELRAWSRNWLPTIATCQYVQ